MTQTLKPRPVYKKQVVTKKKTTGQPKSLPSLPKPYVQSHLSDIQLIKREALLNDFKQRMEINNREIGYAWGDFKTVLTKVKELINA
tara:strand:+ start:115 stop:375 length:261 start_codon:yes stop_codon:yes gene_type:complete